MESKEVMKTDCIFYDDCYLPPRLCTDDCGDYEPEGTNPFQEEEDRGCEKLHFMQDMGEI